MCFIDKLKSGIILFLIYITCAYATTVSAVKSNIEDNQQIISINFSDKIANPQVFLNGNDLIIDFLHVDNGLPDKNISFIGGKITHAKASFDNSKFRLIIYGGANCGYITKYLDNAFKITFVNNELIQNVDKISSKILTNSAKHLTINDLNFSRDDNNGGLITLPYLGFGKLFVEDNKVGNNLEIYIHNIKIDNKLITKLDVNDFATPVKYIDISKYRDGIKLVIMNNKLNWDYAVYQLNEKIIINIRPNDSDKLSKLPNNHDDKVTFNFQNIDIRALLQLMADFSGYNILVSDSVKGSLTIKLSEVDWSSALRIILSTKGLAMHQEDNIIQVAPINEINDLNKRQLDLVEATEARENLETVTWRLKYAKVTTVKEMLEKPFGFDDKSNKSTNLLSFRGTALIDVRTNTIIINDIPSRIELIHKLIDKIDIPVKMVLIEARIVEASSDFERSLGTRLMLSGLASNFTYSNRLENATTINQNGINYLGSINNINNSGSSNTVSSSNASILSGNSSINTNFSNPSTSSFAMIFSPNSNNLIGLEIDALEAQNNGKTISKPKVMTANYQTASIQQGVQIPYQQATSNGNTNVAFVNAVLSLKVTPQITDDGNIMLGIDIHKDTPNTKLQVQGAPSIDTNSVSTTVQASDGSTVLVGGVYLDNRQHVESKVPLLGDIPYLGWLFKSVYDATNKKELLIFITPKVI